MENLIVASAQFEHHCGNKARNLDSIAKLTAEAARKGARIVAFHECCISGYSHARHLDPAALYAGAESVPDGPSVQALIGIARREGMVVMAGLFERDEAGRLFNTYVCVDGERMLAKHRKLHPFIHPDLQPGDSYTLFDLLGWKFGILTCYDNNVVENVRATALLGAQILVMPHVTMMTPSTRPGAGFADPELWRRREEDPTSLRIEFDGLKGRAWLMKWLPSRAYDNGIYVIFSNPIGMDHDQLKNGCSMVLDPFGDVLSECRKLGDEVVTAVCVPEKLRQAGGYRYRSARRPELYGDILAARHEVRHEVVWLHGPAGD